MNNKGQPVTIKGVFIKIHIDGALKDGGEKLKEKLKKEVGKISLVKDYPIETHLKVLKVIGETIFGKKEQLLDGQLGKYFLNVFLGSQLGKTLSSLHGESVSSMLSIIPAVAKLTHKNFSIELKESGENSARLIIENNPYPGEYYAGVFEGGIEKFGKKKPAVTWKEINPGRFQYDLSWE